MQGQIVGDVLNLSNASGKQLHGPTMSSAETYFNVVLIVTLQQVPRYIITLHELLAHTPFDHVERKSLLSARQQLEDLSRQMHDEVSETENLRKNLSVERMIVEGCDILLDVNQVFVRQGKSIELWFIPNSFVARWLDEHSIGMLTND